MLFTVFVIEPAELMVEVPSFDRIVDQYGGQRNANRVEVPVVPHGEQPPQAQLILDADSPLAARQRREKRLKQPRVVHPARSRSLRKEAPQA